MDKKEILTSLVDFAFEVKNNLENKLNPTERMASGTWETWSLKDTLAHIAQGLYSDLEDIVSDYGNIPVFDESNIEAENKKIYSKWAKKPGPRSILFV